MGLAWWEDDSRYDVDGLGHQGHRVGRHDLRRRQGPLGHAGDHHSDPAGHAAAGARVPRSHGSAAAVLDVAGRLPVARRHRRRRSRRRLAARSRRRLAAAESADSVAVPRARAAPRLRAALGIGPPASRQAGIDERPPRPGARSRIGNAADRHRDDGRSARARAVARDRAGALRERLPPAVSLVDHGRPAAARSRSRGAAPQRRARGSAARTFAPLRNPASTRCSTFIRS